MTEIEYTTQMIAESHNVKGFLFNVGVRGSDLDDLVSEVMLVALERRAYFDPERSKMSTWLVGIGKNKFRQYLTYKSRFVAGELHVNDHPVCYQNNLYDIGLITKAINNVSRNFGHGWKMQLEYMQCGISTKKVAELRGIKYASAKGVNYKIRECFNKGLGMNMHRIDKVELSKVIARYIREVRKKFEYTDTLFYTELKLKPLYQELKLDRRIAWLVNRVLLKVDKHRVWSLTGEVVYIYDIIEQFKQYDRDQHKVAYVRMKQDDERMRNHKEKKHQWYKENRKKHTGRNSASKTRPPGLN